MFKGSITSQMVTIFMFHLRFQRTKKQQQPCTNVNTTQIAASLPDDSVRFCQVPVGSTNAGLSEPRPTEDTGKSVHTHTLDISGREQLGVVVPTPSRSFRTLPMHAAATTEISDNTISSTHVRVYCSYRHLSPREKERGGGVGYTQESTFDKQSSGKPRKRADALVVSRRNEGPRRQWRLAPRHE